MKITHNPLFALLIGGLVSVQALYAGTTTVLEGFENGFTTNSLGKTNLALFTEWGNLPLTVSLYTATGPGDPRVTQGTNSVKITFSAQGFGNDLSFSLSDAASVMVEAAASSNQLARYVLRYDVIFEHIDQLSYYNQHCLLANDWDYVRSGGAMVTNYNGEMFGVSSFSIPLESTNVGIPNGPNYNASDFTAAGIPGLTAIIVDQFAVTNSTFTNFTIYLDNFRLIDTYGTPTNTPVVYELQSFEGPGNIGGATNLPGTSFCTLFQYTTNGQYNPSEGITNVDSGLSYIEPQVSDFSVTQGTNSLGVSNNMAGYTTDFNLALGNTRLGQILSLGLTPAQLSHFTLRWETTMPLVTLNGNDGDYMNMDYNTSASALPMSQGRRQSDGQYGLQQNVYSMTLDQVLSWGFDIYLTFSFDTVQNEIPAIYYYDNFRLIDTAPGYTYITSSSFSLATHQFTMVWLSTPGYTYAVQYSPRLSQSFTNLVTGIASGGDYTTNTFTIPSGNAGYVQVVAP